MANRIITCFAGSVCFSLLLQAATCPSSGAATPGAGTTVDRTLAVANLLGGASRPSLDEVARVLGDLGFKREEAGQWGLDGDEAHITVLHSNDAVFMSLSVFCHFRAPRQLDPLVCSSLIGEAKQVQLGTMGTLEVFLQQEVGKGFGQSMESLIREVESGVLLDPQSPTLFASFFKVSWTPEAPSKRGR